MKPLYILYLTLLYFLSRIPFLRFYPVFYDSFEYVQIANRLNFTNFSQVVSSSHQPIHTFYFLAILFLKNILGFLNPEAIMVLLSLISGYLTIIVWFTLVRRYYSAKKAFFSSLLLMIMPYFFVLNTNILYESPLLLLQVAACFFLTLAMEKKSKIYIAISALFWGLSISVFIGSLFLFPIFLLLLIILSKQEKFIFLTILVSVSLAVVLGLDLLLLKSPVYIGEKFISHYLDFISLKGGLPLFGLRFLRNIIMQFSAILSLSGLVIVSISFLFMVLKNRSRFYFYAVLVFPAVALTQYWHAGLFGRLAIYIIFPSVLLITEVFHKKWHRILIVFLILLTMFNYARHQQNHPALYSYYSLLDKYRVDSNIAIITSDYNRFLYEKNRENLFIIKDADDNSYRTEQYIDGSLKKNKTVLIDSAGLHFPYYQYDGDFYHVLSLGKTGESKASGWLAKYDLSLFAEDEKNSDVYFMKISRSFTKHKITPVVTYPPGKGNISLYKTYSWDPLAKIIYLIFGYNDPVTWKYQ